MNVGSGEFLADRIEEFSAQQSLAGANFTGDLDEPFATAKCHQQNVQAILVARPVQKEAGIGGQRKWRFSKTEML